MNMKKMSFLLAVFASAPLLAAPGDSESTPFHTSSRLSGTLDTVNTQLPSTGTPRDNNNYDTASYMDT